MSIGFRTFTILIAFLFTLLLFISIVTLFLIPNPHDVLTAIKSEEMIYSLKLSLITGAISTFLVILFGVPIGYALSRYEFPGKSVVKSILDLPMAFPELVLGLALLLFFGKTFIGEALTSIGIKVVFTKLGIIVAQFFTALPYAVRVIYSTFEEISPRYELVSRSLGYNEFETFLNVTLPMAKNGLFASTIISFARSMGAFGAVLILAGGSYMNTETLPITLYLNISYGNIGMAITSGIVLVVVSFITILVFEKLEGEKMPLLEVKNLSIIIGDFHLQDINLSVEKNEYLTIIGPTGAGKSILLEAIAGFYPLKSGKIYLEGRDITNLPPEKRGMSIVYQDYMLFPHMSVFDNIAYGLRKLKFPKDKIKEEVVKITEELHIDHLLYRKPTTLSGGEMQRVALARALVVKPKVLLMDEPFSALDPRTREKLRGLVKKVIEEYETTVIHITHDFEDVFAMATKVAIMKGGRILQVGEPEEIFSKPTNDFVANFVRTNILKGKVIGKEDNLTLIDVNGIILKTIDDVEKENVDVVLSLRPEEIILAKNPCVCSAQNVVPVVVEDIKRRGHFIEVYLNGNLNVRGMITPNSAEILNLKKGDNIYALFKSSCLRVITSYNP